MKTVLTKKAGAVEAETYGLLYHFLFAALGFALSQAPLLGSGYPFGVSLAAGVKPRYLTAAAVGAGLGYLLNLSAGLVYLAALAAVVTVKVILGGAGRFMAAPLFGAALALAAVLVTGLSVTVIYSTGQLLQSVCSAAVAAAAAYFISIMGRISPIHSTGLDIAELVSVVFTASLVLAALSRFQLFRLNLGQILGTVLILLAARFGQAAYGAVGGAIFSLSLLLSTGSAKPEQLIFTFCGLMAGVFSAGGTVVTVLAYILTAAVIGAVLGDYTVLVTQTVTALIGGGLFLCIPRKVRSFLSGMFAGKAEISRPDTLKGELVMRLEFASGALKDIFETVEDVSNRLQSVTAPDFEKTLNQIEQETCGGCSLRRHCWEAVRSRTAADTAKLWSALKSQKYGEEIATDLTETPCLRPEALKKAVAKNCAELESRRLAEQRLGEVRGVISDQFSGISQMLFDLAEEFKYEVRHDGKAAETVLLAMKDLGYRTVSCVCARDKFGRLSADIRIKGVADKYPNKMEILQHLSRSLGVQLDTPCISGAGDEAFISITEKPVYKLEIGVAQIPRESGRLCGDTCRYFCDGHGRMILLLSDGMGTGGRAAVDSAMVSGLMGRMLQAGFGYDCSLKLINSSMIFKSTDESLATVDLAAFDLFNGHCELLKAGAAPTVVRQNGKMGCAESRSLPPGILRDITFDRAEVHLKEGDILVMMSDGVTTEGTDWICGTVKAWDVGSAQQLADRLAAAARRRRDDGHHDDITVLTAIVKK